MPAFQSATPHSAAWTPLDHRFEAERSAHVPVVRKLSGHHFTFVRNADGFFDVELRNCHNVTEVTLYSTENKADDTTRHVWWTHKVGPTCTEQDPLHVTKPLDTRMDYIFTQQHKALYYVPLVALPHTQFHLEFNEGAKCDVCYTEVFDTWERRQHFVQYPTLFYIYGLALAKHGRVEPAKQDQQHQRIDKRVCGCVVC